MVWEKFWPGMLTVVVAIILGNLLGQLVCRLIFPPAGERSSGEGKVVEKK